MQQGLQVFAISWRNPHARHRDWGFDAYGGAIIEALDAVQTIAGTKSAHLLATCSGGILAAMVAAHLNEIGEGDRLASLMLAVTVLDQAKAGFAAAAMDEKAAKTAIRTSARKGYLDGRALAEVFAWLRPTDLVWRYWVNNYVQGRSPARVRRAVLECGHHPDDCALHRDMVMMGLKIRLPHPMRPPCWIPRSTCRRSRRAPTSSAASPTTSARGRPPTAARGCSAAGIRDTCCRRAATSRRW